MPNPCGSYNNDDDAQEKEYDFFNHGFVELERFRYRNVVFTHIQLVGDLFDDAIGNWYT